MKDKLRNGYTKLAITIIFAGIVLILIAQLAKNPQDVIDTVNLIRNTLAPFVYGLIIAYLLCPVYNWSVRNTYRLSVKKFKKGRTALTFARVVGTVISLCVLTAVVGGLAALVVPEVVRSIIGLIQVIPERITEILEWLRETFAAADHPAITNALESGLTQIRDNLVQWTQERFLPRLGIYMTQISQGLIITVRTIGNIFIGLIICVYVLNGKETFKAHAKKVITATMSKENSDNLFEFAYFTNRTFGGFINGKLIDSAIMGVLCFVVMSVLKMPYVVLISTIVGVTNFIPFFGPFIGAIPSALIICLVDPIKMIYFLIMILVLQQIDGNIIGPKILGETTGLASFWVMFAIIVSGGLFGFTGMVLGVPVFSLIYYYFKKYIEKRLAQKNRPVETKEYQEFNAYDINRKDVQ